MENTPVGRVIIAAGEHGLSCVEFSEEGADLPREVVGISKAGEGLLEKARAQLEEYFAGKRKQFDLPCEYDGTLFQKAVWKTLSRIPYGETRSYGAIAAAIGFPKAARAVGHACGANKIPIIVPCHRVVGANGALTGFAGGLGVKALLLELERKYSRSW